MPGQLILSIDATLKPPRLQVVEVDGRTVRVVESRETSNPRLFDPSLLMRSWGTEVRPSEQNPEPVESGAFENSEAASNDATQTPPTEDLDFQDLSSSLRADILALETSYTSSVLIASTVDYLSFNLDLPFSDSRQIKKIIDLEVQDRVPFDIEEFLIEHHVLDPLTHSAQHRGHDVHVSILPRPLLANIVRICKGAGVEPLIVTTISSALEGMFILAPQYFKEDSAVILIRDNVVHVAIRIQGRVRIDRIFDLNNLAENIDDPLRALSTELRLTLLAAESRYGRKIEQIYTTGDSISVRDLQQSLGRSAEVVRLEDLMSVSAEDASIAALAAPFAHDDPLATPLTNFRTREFSYSLQLSELFLGLRRLGSMFAITALALAAFLIGSYIHRESSISRLEASMQEATNRLLPNLPLTAGSEVETIQAENVKLDRALESLGSGSLEQYTALDLFREISAALPPNPAIVIRSISIRGNRIRLQGSAPEYKDVEAIERALQRNRTVKFRAKPPEISAGAGAIPGGARTMQNFSFDIRVEN